MKVTTFIKIVAALAVLVMVGATVMVTQRMVLVNAGTEVAAPRNAVEAIVPDYRVNEAAVERLLSKLDVEHMPDITPGLRAYEAACALLEAGEFIAAEQKLQYVNAYYPSAAVADDARRIIGEMNLDSLFDANNEQIQEYTVQKGDSYYKIVNQHEMSLDFLMFINQLHRVDRLYPGQKLKVMAQEYRMQVDVKRGILSIWDGVSFVKGYSIQSHTLPQREADVSTELLAVEGHLAGKRIKGPGSSYRDSSKVLILNSPQVEVRAVGDDALAAEQTIFMKRADIEELSVLLRSSNSVEIRY
ncbi:LysM peptidoglycan-binding domain-containing protein [Rubritalea marina]|uniref:LysM peptidoglycan-binding domain-containing protein n=1 Tax=Rubritalea marina TaxID=361055 RepID=UPI000367E7D1|nr:LysM domain-containing protein [Rubritalea marina]